MTSAEQPGRGIALVGLAARGEWSALRTAVSFGGSSAGGEQASCASARGHAQAARVAASILRRTRASADSLDSSTKGCGASPSCARRMVQRLERLERGEQAAADAEQQLEAVRAIRSLSAQCRQGGELEARAAELEAEVSQEAAACETRRGELARERVLTAAVRQQVMCLELELDGKQVAMKMLEQAMAQREADLKHTQEQIRRLLREQELSAQRAQRRSVHSAARSPDSGAQHRLLLAATSELRLKHGVPESDRTSTRAPSIVSTPAHSSIHPRMA